MHHVYLSDRNVLTLLSKLDRLSKGEHTFCTVFKNDNVHPVYPQTMPQFCVVATETELGFSCDTYDTAGTVKIDRHTLNALIASREPVTIPSKQEYVEVMVHVVTDDAYYTHRNAGPMHPLDAPAFGAALH